MLSPVQAKQSLNRVVFKVVAAGKCEGTAATSSGRVHHDSISISALGGGFIDAKLFFALAYKRIDEPDIQVVSLWNFQDEHLWFISEMDVKVSDTPWVALVSQLASHRS